jgi:two-component sensor histidine kinase
VLPLSFLSDALIAVAFVVIPVSFFFVINRQERLNEQVRTAAVLYSAGMLSVAISFVAPHAWPHINGTIYEFLIKLFAALTMLAAAYVSWPLIRLATQHTRLLASLPDTELLIMERDDLAAAKSELEKEVVKRSYQLERVNRQMLLALIGSRITMFRQDRDLRYTWIFNAPEGTAESDFIGRTDAEIFPADVALAVTEIKNEAARTDSEHSAETKVRFPHGNFWYFLRTQPDYDEHGKIIGTISCAIDITEQKRQQQRLMLLMREATHRSKNLLAVLQSIVRQTARRTQNIEEFLTRLNARLQAIARSHDLLVNDDWSGTSLRKLLESQLSVLSDVEPARIKYSGQDLLLTSVAVQNLGLAFHELSVNAMRHGALSEPRGTVDISWAPSGRSGDIADQERSHLRLVWRELGGPNVSISNESGFGRMLLERVVGQALGGSVRLDFAPSGFVCTMVLPLSRIVAAEEIHQAPEQGAALAFH